MIESGDKTDVTSKFVVNFFRHLKLELKEI